MRTWTKLILTLIYTLSCYQLNSSLACKCEASNVSISESNTMKNNNCSPENFVNLFLPTTNATGIFAKSYKICYCITKEKLDNYTWKFEGKPLRTSKWKIFEGNTGISTSYLDMEDAGEYNCSFGFSVRLNILKNVPDCEPPQNPRILPNSSIYALSGKEDVKWLCTAFVGEDWLKAKYTLQFFKRPNNKALRSNDDIRIDVNISSEGIIKGELIIKKVKKYDYGDYFCNITKYHHQVIQNFSLINGVPEHDSKIGILRTLVTVFCAAIALITIFLAYWLRCRIYTILLCKDNIRESHNRTVTDDDFQFDLLIVHGDDSERWVMLQLLPVIERGAKYLCFVKARDMIGGISIAEQLSWAMYRSRRAIIITSPLLFDSDWAVLASYSAVAESLRSGGRDKITVIILEKFEELSDHSSKHANLIKLLKEFPTIEVPPDVKSEKLSSTEMHKIIKKIFFSILLIRNPHLNILEHESRFDVGSDVCVAEEQYPVVINQASLNVKSIFKTMVRLFWFQIHSVIAKDLTHQFWSNIFRALPPSPINLSVKNSMLKTPL